MSGRRSEWTRRVSEFYYTSRLRSSGCNFIDAQRGERCEVVVGQGEEGTEREREREKERERDIGLLLTERKEREMQFIKGGGMAEIKRKTGRRSRRCALPLDRRVVFKSGAFRSYPVASSAPGCAMFSFSLLFPPLDFVRPAN